MTLTQRDQGALKQWASAVRTGPQHKNFAICNQSHTILYIFNIKVFRKSWQKSRLTETELRAQSAFVYLRLFHCQAIKPPWTWVSVSVDIRNGTLSETVLLISQKSCRCHSFYCYNKKTAQ